MADAKQPHLNGAYYGPSIPPPRKAYHRPGRGSGCNPCTCLCSCIFNLIFQIVFTVLVAVGIALLVFWLIFRPNKVKFHVTDATLTDFNFSTSTNTLYYNLALNMTIRNPNKRIGIYYDRIEARAYYEDQRFDAVTMTPFYQGHKMTNTLSPVFQGQNMVMLGSSEVSKYNSDKSDGIYNIDVKLYLRIRFKLGAIKTPKFKPKIECDLKVPLHSNGTILSGTFETTKCDIDW
ncbi:NDR1/HIN1-like protein 10 [Cornus florida]|uniref:NDR1/HIN1-like protein 10 n=1 Tax=Cornus florida TaxID=4283 RepID=UPI0028973B1B|nr:NDR1/HIN1-like protein 10 [Cornus florida]